MGTITESLHGFDFQFRFEVNLLLEELSYQCRFLKDNLPQLVNSEELKKSLTDFIMKLSNQKRHWLPSFCVEMRNGEIGIKGSLKGFFYEDAITTLRVFVYTYETCKKHALQHFNEVL